MVLTGVIESFIGTFTANMITLGLIYFFVLPKIKNMFNPMAGVFDDA